MGSGCVTDRQTRFIAQPVCASVTMRRLTAILNPYANRGRAGRLAASLRHRLGSRFELQVLETTQRGEAVDLVRSAADSGADGVLAIGGDGTVHEVANGLLTLYIKARPPLGILPAGTGNDFAYALGIDGDVDRTVRLLERGETRTIDTVLVETGSGRRRYAINNVGTLLEATINLASHQLRWPRGSGLYLRALIRTLRRPPPLAILQVRCDGREFTRRTSNLSFNNGCRSGGMFYLSPDARVDDGRIDYLITPPASRLRLVWEISKSLRRRRKHDTWVERGDCAEMIIRSDIPMAAHVDGEPWLWPEEGEREIKLVVLPGSLKVFSPSPAARR